MTNPDLKPEKDDARARSEEALKKLCPPITVFYNTFIAIDSNGEQGREMMGERCNGHETLLEAQACAEVGMEANKRQIKVLLRGAQRIMDAANKAGVNTKGLRIGTVKMAIIKESCEVIEENHG